MGKIEEISYNTDKLIGKTIAKAKIIKLDGFDDIPILDLTFTDGTGCVMEAMYDQWTGESSEEYPRFLAITYDYE